MRKNYFSLMESLFPVSTFITFKGDLKTWGDLSRRIFLLFVSSKKSFYFIFIFNFWLRWVFIAACGLLIVVASFVVEHWF